jgi:hypothetical protein
MDFGSAFGQTHGLGLMRYASSVTGNGRDGCHAVCQLLHRHSLLIMKDNVIVYLERMAGGRLSTAGAQTAGCLNDD